MTSNLENSSIKFPIRVISYYASSKGIDGKNCFNFWMRSALIRVIADKPFARGDVLEISNITKNGSNIIIECKVINEWAEYPVLCFVSGRLTYNKWSNFKYTSTEGIQILQSIEQLLSNNYSIGFITLVYKSGKLFCDDDNMNNHLEIDINLDQE